MFKTGYINQFHKNKNTITMTFRFNDAQLLKNITEYGKKLRS